MFNTEISFHTRHPVLLPRDHYLTTLVVWRAHHLVVWIAHQRVLHKGVKEALTEVRARYCIVKGCAFVRKVIHHCVICKRFEARLFLGHHLRHCRTSGFIGDPPFTFTGVNFAGPLQVEWSHDANDSKAWIFLYACCVIQAVHLDVVPNLTTSAFICSLKRFSA